VTIVGYPRGYTAHVDHFARDNLPPPELWPQMRFEDPEFTYPERMNCGAVLLDDAVAQGHGDRIAIYAETETWSYAQLLERTNRIANVLVRELGVVTGNRVLLRAPNSPMLIAAWLAVMKVGAIAVTTMPMLRAKELQQIVTKARIDHALCDVRFIEEVTTTSVRAGRPTKTLTWGEGALENLMRRQPDAFENADTASDDVCLLAFTSGTTGEPKATMHFHRDVLIMADVVARHLLRTAPDDIYLGSPPLGFTFGLGALLVFPLRFRAATVMIEQPSPEALLTAVEKYEATCLFTAPTMYRVLTHHARGYDLASLRQSVSAGEPLPKATSDAWHEATGIRLIDGIGATELIHIFISASGDAIRPGATGKPLPGYEAVVLDEGGRALSTGHVGRLAVRGPTGCRYLADAERQRQYVIDGWNVTGDRYRIDDEGYFWFQARTDEMIVSAGYNIAGPEVECALAANPAVLEVAVIGVPDATRGQLVKAFVVLSPGFSAGPAMALELQEFVKATVAPYKYPRVIEFVPALPKTPTGKVKRFELRDRNRGRATGPNSSEGGDS
jgi:2-aminobenzoate-CoA ligase